MPIELKRAYEEPLPADGCRVLVERLWPRGLAKSEAKIDLWPKEVAPSTEFRRWFKHVPELKRGHLLPGEQDYGAVTPGDDVRIDRDGVSVDGDLRGALP
jgi:hypothetical protein